MKKILLLLTLLASAILCGSANAGKESLPAIYMLLLNSGQSGPATAHQAAVVGPLSNAEITAHRITSLDQSVEGPKNAVQSNDLLTAGTFGLALSGVADDDWIVVSASGGTDIDHNGDGTVDPSPTINKGTLHAVAKAADWRNKHLRITPLTELAYRFTEHLFSQIPQDELAIRLQDLARYLIKTDIDGSGTVDWNDILLFNPANPEHRDKLTTSYDWLSTVNDEGHSIIDSLLAGNEKQMLSCMDEIYSYLMTRFPVPDSRYHSVKITLSVFGPGSATSDAPANLAVDSTLAEPVYADHVFLPENESESVTFTATPTQDTKILHWSGCETVSADLSQCTVPLNKSQSVVINFGRTATTLQGPIHNLTRTTNVVEADTISVLIPDDMTDMIAEMASAAVDDFVVGDDGEGFLRRITGINQVSTTYYILDTVDANLDEVILDGTGYLFHQLENGDLEGYTAATSPATTAKVAPTAFSGIKGVRFIVSDDPHDTTFRLVLGEQESFAIGTQSFTESASVTLYEDSYGNTLSATGEVSIDITLDKYIDYDWGDLKSLKFITIIDAEQEIELAASNELAKFDFVKEKIGSFRFSPIVFSIGVVPVWVSPIIDVFFFAEGKVEAEVSFGVSFSQSVEGGVLFNEDTGWSIHSDFSSDRSFIPPTGKISASISGGIEANPVLKIYDATGPAIPQRVYAKMKASASTEIFGTCSDVVLKNSVGFTSAFMWDLSGSSKFGRLLHLDQLEEKTRFNIVDVEWQLGSYVLYDNCPEYVAGSYLAVDGDGIFSTIDAGDPNGLVTNLTVSNDGDETLHWNISFIPPEVTINPSSGELSPGEETIVQMSVATAGLPVGHYLKKPFFFNEASVGSDLPDEQFGNTWKTIDITVNGTISDVPTITSATSTAVGGVTLNWSFTPSGTEPFVGFQIFTTDTPADPQSYQLIYTTDIYTQTATIFGFTPGTTYSFDMRACSNNGAAPGPFSNKVSVTVGGNPPPPFGVVYSAGQLWADRNLGASRVATSSTDTEAYGDLYQWGRLADGHESRTSPSTLIQSSTDVPGHGNFVTTLSPPYDWRNPQNNFLWQGGSGINNPCPSGFRLPTATEWETERISWSSNNSTGAFTSPLKLVMGGNRNYGSGSLYDAGNYGYYWSSTAYVTAIRHLGFYSGYAEVGHYTRANGLSVRCLKN